MYEYPKNDGIYDAYLAHHGTLGMHWGQRRYQNEDGSYKPGAEGRYYTPTGKHQKDTYKALKKAYKKNHDTLVGNKEFGNRIRSEVQQYITPEEIERLEKARKRSDYSNFEKESKYDDEPYDPSKNDDDYMLSEKGTKDFWDAQNAETEECKKVIQRILGEYGNKKVSALSNSTYADRGAAYLQMNILGVEGWDKLKFENPNMRLKTIESDQKTITDQVSKIMLNDLKRWDSDVKKSKSKEDYAKIQKSIQKQVSDGLKDYKNTGRAHESFPDGTINFIVDGGKDYADGQGLEVIYDPKNRKVVGTYWA